MLRQKFNKNDIGACFGIAVLATVIVSLVASLVAQIFNIDLQDGESTATYAFNIIATAVNTLCIGASVFIYSAPNKVNAVTATKMKTKPPVAHIGWGCLATLCLITFMIPLNGWISKLIVAMGLPEPAVSLDMDIISMIICAAVLPAFCEEVIFRGAVAGSLEGNKNKLASLAVAGGLFALFHMNPAQTVHQFALGAMLALLFFRSGSLWTTVIVHFFNNIFVIALSAIFGEKIDVFFEKNAIWLFFVGLVCFAGCIAGYLFTTKSKWQAEQTDEEEPKYSKGCLILLFSSAGVCLLMWIITLFVGVE